MPAKHGKTLANRDLEIFPSRRDVIHLSNEPRSFTDNVETRRRELIYAAIITLNGTKEKRSTDRRENNYLHEHKR